MKNEFDTVLQNMRLREGSASFTMPFNPAIAKWAAEMGRDHEITLTVGIPSISRWVRVLRRILSFCYGWLGYRPPMTGQAVYHFIARMSEIDRTGDIVTVSMDQVRGLEITEILDR